MKKRQFSDKQLEEIGEKLSKTLLLWNEIYNESMKGLTVKSSECLSIRSAGKKIETACKKMRTLAEKQGWSYDKVDEFFTSRISCGFG